MDVLDSKMWPRVKCLSFAEHSRKALEKKTFLRKNPVPSSLNPEKSQGAFNILWAETSLVDLSQHVLVLLLRESPCQPSFCGLCV
jgi:hypothetical protein